MKKNKSFQIVLQPDCSYLQKKLAVELSTIIGFESVSMKFPIAAAADSVSQISAETQFVIYPGKADHEKIEFADGKINIYVPECQEAVDRICLELMKKFPVPDLETESEHEIQIKDFKASSDTPYPVEPADKRLKKGLESLFEIGSILKDNDGDMMPDEVSAKILIDDSMTLSQTLAVCNLAARIGMETLGIIYPMTIEKDDGVSNLFKICSKDENGIFIEDLGRKVITLAGDGKGLERFSASFCESFPKVGTGKNWLKYMEELLEGFKLKTLDGQLSLLEANRSNIGDSTVCYFSPTMAEKDGLAQQFPGVEFKNYKDLKKVYEEEYDIPWEVDVCKSLLEDKVFKNTKAGDCVEIQIALSEDQDSRRRLYDYVIKRLEQKQVKVEQLDILCAYKQGFSWIDEKIIPAILKIGKKPAAINIAFRPFLPEGVTEWSDEDGATPKVTSAREDNPDKWFDLPIRYLQELYPIDDVISEKLGIDRNFVKFTKYEGDKDVTYTVCVLAEDGEEILSDCYKAACSERRYIDEYPGIGLVHPGTGYLRVKVNGNFEVDENIKTDLENIWDIYQSRILPYCKNYIDRISGGKPIDSMQPFFSQMRLDIDVSEPDYYLNCRQDMISSINSLHEDIYFVGLDFFKVYGTRTTGSNLDAPGLILPVINKAEGKPRFKFTLFDQQAKCAVVDLNGRQVGMDAGKITADAVLRSIRMKGDNFEAVVAVESEQDLSGFLCSYASLMEKGILDVSYQLDGISYLTIEFNGMQIASVELPEKEKIEQGYLDIRDIDIMENRLIGYDDYLRIIEQIKRVKGLEVYQVAESYQGRKIYAIEIKPDYQGYVSKTKLINLNPVEYINSRHHANEVSSTNSCFMLLKELLTNKKYKGIANRLNLVLIPFENADGAAIHYELQKDNPNWKLHIARFNSLGKEIAREYFNDNTIHTEAHAFTRVWRKWLPDIVTDDHGVPSHEWDQQFSGYTSPWFKGFWMPRALLYSYFEIITDEEYSSNVPVNKKMEDVVAESMLTDETIKGLNQDWQNRFEKYAHQWMPKLFPANYYKDLINYWVTYTRDVNNSYTSVRFPWITTVSFVSEVSDETAQGDYLNLCAKAHKTHDIAVIDMLLESKCVFKKSTIEQDGSIKKLNIRKRPLICE